MLSGAARFGAAGLVVALATEVDSEGRDIEGVVSGQAMTNLTDSKGRFLARLHGAFIDEEHQGLMVAAKVRSLALIVVIVWQLIDHVDTGAAYFYAIGELTVLLLLGLAQFDLIKFGRSPVWVPFVWVVTDVVVLSIIFTLPNPFETDAFAPAMALRGSGFVWYFLLLMQATFSFRPLLVLWCGLCIVLARLGSLFWVLSEPGSFSGFAPEGMSVQELQALYFNPDFVYLGDRVSETLAVILVAAGLAIVVSRTRQFVESRSEAERARSKLARYFSPNMVDEISSAGGIGVAGQDQEWIAYCGKRTRRIRQPAPVGHQAEERLGRERVPAK